MLRTVTVTADGTSSRVGWGRQDRTRSGLRTTLSRVHACLAVVEYLPVVDIWVLWAVTLGILVRRELGSITYL